MMRPEVIEAASLEATRQAFLVRHGDFDLAELRLSEVLLLRGLVGDSPSISRLRSTLKKVAAIDAPVLIVGPTGSGKELAARAIHALSSRRGQPVVTINCGALTESLVEAQLFGHEKGYFTGADRARDGYLTEAGRGTLFLDEIAELPLSLQTKLLRVLDNRTFRILGAPQDSRFDGCIIAATHVDLQSRVREGRVREDLYYRLEVLTISVPPLNERKQDIPLLVEHFLRKTNRRLRFAPETFAALEQLDWPGNVRQLRNLVQRLATFAEREVITAADVELHRAAKGGQAADLVSVPQQSACAAGEDLVRGLSIRRPRRQNALQLAQNQIRLLELEGAIPMSSAASWASGELRSSASELARRRCLFVEFPDASPKPRYWTWPAGRPTAAERRAVTLILAPTLSRGTYGLQVSCRSCRAPDRSAPNALIGK